MPLIDAVVACPVADSFRVQQVAGLFDLPLAAKAQAHFGVEVPSLEEHWQIGAIVGPSGSGKSTIARAAFGDALYRRPAWSEDRAVVDGFGELPIKEIVLALTAVGFASPPAWVKPYHVLSNGEKFRCDLARALLGGPVVGCHASASSAEACPGNADMLPRGRGSMAPSAQELVVFDEFTSVVDRTAAKIGAAAIAKAIRSGKIQRRFVAVTCHYDVLEWLSPDWVVDMATCQLARGCLRRPDISIQVVRCRNAAWRLFARHHYLSGELNPACQCFLALWNEEPVAFLAAAPMLCKKAFRRVSRLVVLPDFQGVGIGGAMLDDICELYRVWGIRTAITTSHPAMILHLKRSPRWRLSKLRKTGSGRAAAFAGHQPRTSLGRCVASFEYRGEKNLFLHEKAPWPRRIWGQKGERRLSAFSYQLSATEIRRSG